MSGYQKGGPLPAGPRASFLLPSAEKSWSTVSKGPHMLREISDFHLSGASHWCPIHSGGGLVNPCQLHPATANFTLLPPSKSQFPRCPPPILPLTSQVPAGSPCSQFIPLRPPNLSHLATRSPLNFSPALCLQVKGSPPLLPFRYL